MVKFVTKCLFFLFAVHLSVSAQTASRIVCDDNCKTESGAAVVKGDGFAVVSPVGRGTVQIELPRDWDKLMQEKGYRPISEFYIK